MMSKRFIKVKKILIPSFFSILMLSSLTSWGQDLPYAGVWQGYIGKSPVMVCFGASDDSQYYYFKYRTRIVLYPEAKPYFWSEDLNISLPLPQWQLTDVKPNQLTGQWQSFDENGQAKAPITIALKKLANLQKSANNQLNCSSVFYDPIVNKLKFHNQPRQFEGHDYTQVTTTGSTGELTSFEIPDQIRGANVFNRFMRQAIEDSAKMAFYCSGSFETEAKPRVWLNDLLVVENSDSYYCGGAHPDGNAVFTSFDLKTGKPINTWVWIKDWQKSV